MQFTLKPRRVCSCRERASCADRKSTTRLLPRITVHMQRRFANRSQETKPILPSASVQLSHRRTRPKSTPSKPRRPAKPLRRPARSPKTRPKMCSATSHTPSASRIVRLLRSKRPPVSRLKRSVSRRKLLIRRPLPSRRSSELSSLTARARRLVLKLSMISKRFRFQRSAPKAKSCVLSLMEPRLLPTSTLALRRMPRTSARKRPKMQRRPRPPRRKQPRKNRLWRRRKPRLLSLKRKKLMLRTRLSSSKRRCSATRRTQHLASKRPASCTRQPRMTARRWRRSRRMLRSMPLRPRRQLESPSRLSVRRKGLMRKLLSCCKRSRARFLTTTRQQRRHRVRVSPRLGICVRHVGTTGQRTWRRLVLRSLSVVRCIF
eukprot:comp22483_c0_seq11/m.55775 comp22483_c0_seq11/g.55775  ORF comp22483_c0_seq11/g.55775 comp22483_c0_seq11/m.55775 type:complete len:375 (-) comp22483_c0_seq11:8-1132(-)